MILFPRFDVGGTVDSFPFTDPMTGFTPDQEAQYLGDAGRGYLDWLSRQPAYAPYHTPTLRDTMPLALGLAGGGIFGDAAGAAHFPAALESRVVPAYNPPIKPQCPFAADYPGGAPTDGTGRLTTDIDGRPLGAQYVAGRRVVGQPDEALTPAAVDAIATTATGESPQAVAPREISGDAGQLIRTVDPNTGATEWNIAVNRTLSDPMKDRVLAHETGHLIDELSGQIPTDGLKTELTQVYNTLNTGRERTRNLTGPQHLGYRGGAADRELMAEAIRGYMTDPNYLKTVAPRTAATIRAYVNANPRLAPLIQFNAIGARRPGAGRRRWRRTSDAAQPHSPRRRRLHAVAGDDGCQPAAALCAIRAASAQPAPAARGVDAAEHAAGAGGDDGAQGQGDDAGADRSVSQRGADAGRAWECSSVAPRLQ